MNLPNFCLKKREKEAKAQKYPIAYALIGSSLLYSSAAWGGNFLWQKKPELTKKPIEAIVVDAPKLEVKPTAPKPIPETQIANTPTRPTTIKARPVDRIVIGEGGEVVESQLAKTSGHSQLDQAAIASSRNMVFAPPGTKVAVRVPINFTIKDSDFHQEALERERQAQLQQQQQRQEVLERERERVQQQRQQRIDQESRRQEYQREQQMQQQIPGQENQPQQPQPRLPSVFDEKP